MICNQHWFYHYNDLKCFRNTTEGDSKEFIQKRRRKRDRETDKGRGEACKLSLGMGTRGPAPQVTTLHNETSRKWKICKDERKAEFRVKGPLP